MPTAAVTNGIDSILNIVVPLIAFGVLGFAIYKGFKEPIDQLIGWAKEKFANMGSDPTSSPSKSYSGRRSPYGIEGGDISYR
jgi:hypothetical protein